MHAFGLFMTSLADEYYQFLLAQGLCSGIGTAMLFYPSISCTVTWFDKKRASAIGIAAAGAGCGGILFPIILRTMIDHVSFGWTMRTSAFLVLVLGIVASLTISSRIPPTPKKASFQDIKATFKDSVWCLVVASGATSFSALWVVFTFIVTTAISRGVDASWSFYLVPILNGASVLGRIIPGILADRVTGAINMFLLVNISTLLILTCLWIPVSGQAGMIVFSILFGFTSGALNALSPVIIAQISDVKSIGLRTGLCYSFTGLGW
jgi:MFS family permease